MKRKYLADLEGNLAELKNNPKKIAVALSEKKKDAIITNASFLNPAMHFQKDRAIRTLILIEYINKELIGTPINKDLSLIVISYLLSPLYLNSILKIAANNFDGNFYPLPTNIKSDALPTGQRELAAAIIDTLRFLQIDWLKEKLFNPYDLLIAENDKLHSSGTEVLVRNKGMEFLKNISTIATTTAMTMTENLHEPFDQFVEIFLGLINNKEIKKTELINTLYTVMYKALQNYLIELSTIENKLKKYILQESNEDIHGEQKENGKFLSFTPKESAPFFDELIFKTSNEKLRELYLKIKPLSTIEDKSVENESINSYIKEKFTDKELETLILLQCFKWPLAAKYLYSRMFSLMHTNSLIYSTGFIHLADLLLLPAGKNTTINLFEMIHFEMIQENNQAYLFYESRHFLRLLFFLRQNFGWPTTKPTFQTISLHFYNNPGLVDNLLHVYQHGLELEKGIIIHEPYSSYRMMFNNGHRFPTMKLNYELIPYLGFNLLDGNIRAMNAYMKNFRGIAQEVADTIRYYMPSFNIEEQRKILSLLEEKIKLARRQDEYAIFLNCLKKALSVNSNKLTDQERGHFEEKYGLLQKDKFASNEVNFIHSSLMDAMKACNIRSVLKILPPLYNQPGIDNIWLNLMVFTDSLDHPLLFLLRHASEQALVRLEQACPGIWVNLPYDELALISQKNFPVGSWSNNQAKQAFIFTKHLNPHGDTLLTYAVKKSNHHAVSFLIKKDPTLLTRYNNAGQSPVALAESFSDTTILDLLNERIAASLPPSTSPMKKHRF